ncbi:MAG: type I methionyl aminopeptidase [Christensenellales bacterium]|jgi:methionyl aminopeptidase
MIITAKNAVQLGKMRSAGHLLYDVLCALREKICPGMTTKALDAYAEEMIRAGGAIPSFLGYQGFPASICTSIDEQVVHGIPSDKVVLVAGSIISVDCGLILDGWQADSAFTHSVGAITPEKARLIQVTEQCFFSGASAAVAGNRIGDIGSAVQAVAEEHGYSVVRDLTGHGIGQDMHEPPSVPNFGMPGVGIRLRRGMTLALEPMIAMGDYPVRQLSDGWTFVTRDGSPCAHYEHTIAVTNGFPELLTLPGYVFKALHEEAGNAGARHEA